MKSTTLRRSNKSDPPSTGQSQKPMRSTFTLSGGQARGPLDDTSDAPPPGGFDQSEEGMAYAEDSLERTGQSAYDNDYDVDYEDEGDDDEEFRRDLMTGGIPSYGNYEESASEGGDLYE